ncbi:phosphatidylserine decarboxylase [bacterium]|nr:phosphatidylserine decarboxylase [bacterium]
MLILTVFGWGILTRIELLVSASIFAVMIFFTIYFFRDPERNIPERDDVVLAPADGRVIRIHDVSHFSLSEASAKIVTIYLSLWDVHINRVPVSGRVTYLNHSPGCFHPAFDNRSATRNENTMIGISGAMGKIFLKQIAGMIARRIVCRLQMGDQVIRGQRFGMIKFGSRVEMVLPQSVSIKVSVGDRVKGGESIIAEKI